MSMYGKNHGKVISLQLIKKNGKKNTCAPDNRVTNYVKQKLIELEEIDKFTLLAEDFSNFLSIVSKTTR